MLKLLYRQYHITHHQKVNVLQKLMSMGPIITIYKFNVSERKYSCPTSPLLVYSFVPEASAFNYSSTSSTLLIGVELKKVSSGYTTYRDH